MTAAYLVGNRFGIEALLHVNDPDRDALLFRDPRQRFPERGARADVHFSAVEPLETSRIVGLPSASDEPLAHHLRGVREEKALDARGRHGELSEPEIAVALLQKIEKLASALDDDELGIESESSREGAHHLAVFRAGGAHARQVNFSKRRYEDPEPSPLANRLEVAPKNFQGSADFGLLGRHRRAGNDRGNDSGRNESGAFHLALPRGARDAIGQLSHAREDEPDVMFSV